MSLFHSKFYKVLQSSISNWVYFFIHLSLLSTCPYRLRQFNLTFDSECARFNCLYIVDKLALSSNFYVSIHSDIACLLCKTHCAFLCRGQHLLALSKVSLAQLPYNFSHLAKEIVVDVRIGSSSLNFLYAVLIWATLAGSQPPPGRFHHQDNKTTALQQVVCPPKLHGFQVYHPAVYNAPYIVCIYNWDHLSIYL